MRTTEPNSPILFDRTREELEENLLFCIVVAGKKASTQIKLLHDFLNSGTHGLTPFEKIKSMDNDGVLAERLVESRLGQYTRLLCCFRTLIASEIDLHNCTIEDLESIHGIGPKTARFFMTCNRENVRHAVIDTHLLKYMNQHMGLKVPTTTPGNPREYHRLEELYLTHADALNIKPAELDLAIWKMYSNRDDSEYKRLTSAALQPV